MLSDPEPLAATSLCFEARAVPDGDRPVVVVRGELDLAAVADLLVAVDVALTAGPRLALDLRDTTFIDSTGVTALVALSVRLGQIPEAIVLRDPSPPVVRMLELTGVTRLFTVQTTHEPAGLPGDG